MTSVLNTLMGCTFCGKPLKGRPCPCQTPIEEELEYVNLIDWELTITELGQEVKS